MKLRMGLQNKCRNGNNPLGLHETKVHRGRCVILRIEAILDPP